MTSQQLAAASGTTERCVREWLSAQAASGYVQYEPASGEFSMLPEQAMVFADEDSPYFMGAVGDMMSAFALDEPKISEAFRTGKGVSWNDRAECLFCGTARFFRTTYKHQLVQEWLPTLDGVVDRLKRGAHVADIGCGHGVSTILMAKAFPNSRFFGFDAHPGSIEAARDAAMREGLNERVSFAVATAKTVPSMVTIWFVSSIACTIWATRSGRSSTSARRWPATAPACWLSRSRMIGLRPISRRWDACSMQPRPWSARRPRWRRRSASHWAHRPAKRGFARWSAKAVLRNTGG
jgi:SAM-dependent methyltransferase